MGIIYANWKLNEKLSPKSLEELKSLIFKLRGLDKEKEIKEFLDPKKPDDLIYKDLSIGKKEVSAFLARLKKAKKSKELIYIYGDYDADGITSTAILWEALYKRGFNALPYIPSRKEEGYGCNARSVEKLKSQNPELSLVITLDNGITAVKDIESIKKLGIDVIIIDHHQVGKTLPGADIIIHTTITSAAGIAYFLAKEITKEFGKGEDNWLDLATIGVVADQMPLMGVNRSIVLWGLKSLGETKRVGLNALFKSAQIEGKNMGVYDVNYIIAPRINAMGRIAHGIDSLRLLCTPKKTKAEELAKMLYDTNNQRQKIVEGVITEARLMVKKETSVIILSSENYHEGVIGIAAGKLVEEFGKPSIVLSITGDIAKASARSISGFNIIEAINQVSDLLEAAGGHPMAAGFSIRLNNLELFEKRFEQLAGKLLTPGMLEPSLKIDTPLPFFLINQDLVDFIKSLSPFGMGNKEPVFLSRKVKIIDMKAVGRDGFTIKLVLIKNDKILEAVMFGVKKSLGIKKNDLVDIVYFLQENTYNGQTTIQLRIKDINPS